jgi:hypothetical protein
MQAEQTILSPEEEKQLTAYLEEQFLLACYQANPYINFTSDQKKDIQKIYALLCHDIQQGLSCEAAEALHYQRIRSFLKKTNPSTYRINRNPDTEAKTFVCSEYSAQLQLKVLHIDESSLREPILDIGCGEHGRITAYFRSLHKQAFGIDRLKGTHPYLMNADWLAFDYGEKKWGTIIAHMSFTNHFLYHYQENDGTDIAYAQTYMKILHSLCIGGTWSYVPSVPFIEDLLPQDQYRVIRTPVTDEVDRTLVERIADEKHEDEKIQ